MIHTVRPPKPTTSAFTDMINASLALIQTECDLSGTERSDDRRDAMLEAKVEAWLHASVLASSFALVPSTCMAADCRKVVAQQISQVLQ